MTLLASILDKYILAGVPSNAAYDLIKKAWEKASERSWEDLYLDAFEATVVDERPRLAKYADGEITLDRETLRKVLHYELVAPVLSLSLSTLTDEQFIQQLARALAQKQSLTIGGHNLSEEDYAQLVRSLVAKATNLFKTSVVKDSEAFQKALVDLALQNESLLRETQGYLNVQFTTVFQHLDEHAALLRQINASTEDIKNRLTPGVPDTTMRTTAPTPLTSATIKPGSTPNAIHILHLSDIHLGTLAEARKYRMQLETDLSRELGVKRLNYLVLSGDPVDKAAPEEYEAAFDFTSSIMKRFGLDESRVIIVPGNHDVNWDLSEQAYSFVWKRKLPAVLPVGSSIQAGDLGALLRDDKVYRNRFKHFSEHLFEKVRSGASYPIEYVDQGILHRYPADRILFLALNSAWEIDHHYRHRAGINMEALANSLDQIQDGDYGDWIKIAIWHHPVSGIEMMNDEFMQLLSVHGFQMCLHGHVHEAKNDYFRYDQRGVNIIGAGTFGAPTKDQVAGIPLQYNLLSLDPLTLTLTVSTRKKEKPDGAWMADARWGDKNEPSPRYKIQLKNWAYPTASEI